MSNPQKWWQAPATGTLRFAAFLLILLGLFAAIAGLAVDVRARLSAIERADSDNGQWVMMQTEVEALRLQYALSGAVAGRGTIADVRRWYDVLYSRIDMLQRSPLYTGFIAKDENKEKLNQMVAFIQRWQPYIDGPDDQLLAALPQMEAENAAVQKITRELSLAALLEFSATTDETRSRVSETLVRLAIVTLATIVLLGLVAIVLMKVYRTARRQAEENQITGTRLQMIIATSPDAIVVTNRGGWVVEFNPAAETMFGILRERMIGKQVVSKIFPAEFIESYQAQITAAIANAATRGPQRFELEGIRANGERFPLELSIAIRGLTKGALIVAYIRDISARKASNFALQEALTKARAGEKAKAQFLAVMSHEMRTPLNGLIGSIELMRDTPLSADQQNLLRIMDVSGEILLGHVNSVLDISRAEAGEIKLVAQTFDLDTLIADCIANQAGIARSNGSTLVHTALTGPHGIVKGDEGRLRQVLLNLLGNAVKFTRDGSVTLETERLETRAAEGQPGMVEFRIVDTGIGIEANDLDRVFEDFETVDTSYGRENSGTGLGLGIARRLTLAMGGKIGAESEPGAGSVFWVRLPLPPASVTQPVAKAGAGQKGPARGTAKAQKPLHILVIEDNEINRFLVRRYLQDAQHSVVEAVDGVEGVEAAEAQHFDLIITDISMPRMDGIEATRRIRAGNGPSARSRIIALTAHALPEEIAHFKTVGMDICLTKPVTRDVLLSHLIDDTPAPVEQPTLRPIVDAGPLDELTSDLGVPVVRNLISRMIEDGDSTLAQLATHTEPNIEVARIAHQLAGGCATFGAMRLRETLAAIEIAIKSGDLVQASADLARLPGLWAETREALQGRVKDMVA